MKKPNNPNTSRNNQLSGNERIINRANQRRKKNKRKKLIFRISLCAIFLLAGIIFALTMFFNISEIAVTGDKVYSANDVTEKSGVNVGDNLIFISKKKINERITTELPYVGSVKVKRHLPTRLELIVTKTDAVYAVVENGYYTLVDETGKVLEKDLEYIGENIILLNIGEITSAEIGRKICGTSDMYLEKLVSIRTAYKECGIDGITAIDLSDIYDIKLTYQGRIILELGETDEENIYKKLALGKAAIDTQNEENEFYRGTINLSVDGKGYWAEETSSTEPQTEEVESTTENANGESTTKGESEESTTASAA